MDNAQFTNHITHLKISVNPTKPVMQWTQQCWAFCRRL